MSIQLFTPTYVIEECLEEIRQCLEIGWTGMGYKTLAFEDAWKKYTSLPYAHFLSSATAGLHLAVKILKETEHWEEDAEIISTPLTFVSTNHAILYEHLKVVFADVDQYLCLDPVDVEKKITNKTVAIMFVGLGGSTGQYKQIVSLCKKYNLKLILDAAHMAGTRLDGKIPGEEADAVVYSFQAVKNLPTADSGMICFQKQEHDEYCRRLSWLGINKDTYARNGVSGNYKWMYDVEELGYKYHGNSIMAAIGLVQLKYLDEQNEYRRKLGNIYQEIFEKHPTIIKTIPIPKGCLLSRHLYMIAVENREELLQHLYSLNIFPGVHYRDNTEYDLYRYGKGSCPNSLSMSQKILSLPLHLRITEEEVRMIANGIVAFQGAKS